MHDPSVTPEAIKDFKQHPVWEEIEIRLAQKQEVLFSKIIDPASETELQDKLEYRLISEMREYPTLFLKELELEKEEQDVERRSEEGRTGAARRF